MGQRKSPHLSWVYPCAGSPFSISPWKGIFASSKPAHLFFFISPLIEEDPCLPSRDFNKKNPLSFWKGYFKTHLPWTFFPYFSTVLTWNAFLGSKIMCNSPNNFPSWYRLIYQIWFWDWLRFFLHYQNWVIPWPDFKDLPTLSVQPDNVKGRSPYKKTHPLYWKPFPWQVEKRRKFWENRMAFFDYTDYKKGLHRFLQFSINSRLPAVGRVVRFLSV